MDQLEAERASTEGKPVTVQEGSRVYMGKIVGWKGHLFKVRSAEGHLIPDLVAEKISATTRDY